MSKEYLDTVTEPVELAVGRKVLANIRRVNAERRAAKAARRDVIAEIDNSLRCPGRRLPTARVIREVWIAMAPDIPAPSVRSIQEHLHVLRRS